MTQIEHFRSPTQAHSLGATSSVSAFSLSLAEVQRKRQQWEASSRLLGEAEGGKGGRCRQCSLCTACHHARASRIEGDVARRQGNLARALHLYTNALACIPELRREAHRLLDGGRGWMLEVVRAKIGVSKCCALARDLDGASMAAAEGLELIRSTTYAHDPWNFP